MNRGDLYYIKNNKLENGCAQMPDGIAVIVSNDMINATNTTLLVCYLTLNPQGDLPTRVTCRSTGKVSTILCEKVYSKHLSQFGQKIGELTDDELRNMDLALAISLGLDFGESKTVEKIIEKPVEKIVEKVVMREPTEEEIERKALEKLNERTMPLSEDVLECIDDLRSNLINREIRIARAEAERDVYHTMCDGLLNWIMGFAEGGCQ